MNTNQYIKSRFEKILSETISEKTESILNKLNYDEEAPFEKPGGPFDYVQEGDGEMCEQCGGEMRESECMECGSKNEGEIMELGGMDSEHPKFGRLNLKRMSKDKLEKLLGDESDDELEDFEPMYYHKDSRTKDMLDKIKSDRLSRDYGDDDEWQEVDLELDEDEMTEKLYGSQNKLDKNKNGRLDKDDFKKLRSEEDENLYEVEFEKEIEEGETEEGNAFSGALAKAKKEGKDSFKVDGKKYDVEESKKMTESLIFTENELISLIEEMVIEEKKFVSSEPKGYKEYEKVHKADKKENENYLKSVAKKMTDYLKGASDSGSKYEMKETGKFPTENGGMKKGNRKKYTPSDAVDEYIDAFSYPGQTNLVYDEIKPNDEWIKANLVGSSKTGNAQVDKDGKALGNVVPSEVGEKFYKNFKDNLYGQEQQAASYKRQPQPVDQAGEETERGTLKSKRGKKTSQKILNKLDETTNEKQTQKLNEEFGRIQNLMGYNRKTQ
jgi:hypothetical protein